MLMLITQLSQNQLRQKLIPNISFGIQIEIYLHKDIRPLVLIMPKMSGYLKTFKVQDAVNKLPFFHIDDEKLLEKYKAIQTKIEDFKNIT